MSESLRGTRAGIAKVSGLVMRIGTTSSHLIILIMALNHEGKRWSQERRRPRTKPPGIRVSACEDPSRRKSANIVNEALTMVTIHERTLL